MIAVFHRSPWDTHDVPLEQHSIITEDTISLGIYRGLSISISDCRYRSLTEIGGQWEATVCGVWCKVGVGVE